MRNIFPCGVQPINCDFDESSEIYVQSPTHWHFDYCCSKCWSEGLDDQDQEEDQVKVRAWTGAAGQESVWSELLGVFPCKLHHSVWKSLQSHNPVERRGRKKDCHSQVFIVHSKTIKSLNSETLPTRGQSLLSQFAVHCTSQWVNKCHKWKFLSYVWRLAFLLLY